MNRIEEQKRRRDKMEAVKDRIAAAVRKFVEEYEKRQEIHTRWGVPLVGFADANHPDILNLKETIAPSHLLPADVLPNARTVIAYFVPFQTEISYSNRAIEELASAEWALAYEETNTMFRKLNERLVTELTAMGYEAAVSSEAYRFDREKLISNWSQRHFAKAAGLGTFGANNMLITKAGCCGRYSSVVTTLPVEWDAPVVEEYCIFLRSGHCGACFQRCPAGALTAQGYDRSKCYTVCLKNAEQYNQFGTSYDAGTEGEGGSSGSEVCGKCMTNVPCSFLPL